MSTIKIVENDTESPHINLIRIRCISVKQHLRCAKQGCSDSFGLRVFIDNRDCLTEVANLQVELSIEKHVCWLQVTVNDVLILEVLDC